ncbi:zinc finger protein ZAT9-like [Humulus lupulus]|uniref:zinc finger protein ZAT9-like n=1 Tax=Humulus lupulus TaxID=3486 RepID=UPI002B4177D7|nr:zinc finger protein ZAT9-like [Humulus lupulus]
MEKHKCKLCFRSFSNGRALGGHMRSHMLNLPIPPKLEEEEQQPRQPPSPPELSNSAESASSASSSDDDEGEEEIEERELVDEKGVYYGLRENPKRSIRLVDPEFSFPVVDAGSVVLQDRESETESSKNPTRRRSKRTRKSGVFERHHHHHHRLHQEQQQYHKIDHQHHHHQDQEENDSFKKIKLSKLSNKTDSWAEPEPVSSISDATTEEDVAFCLMMLSRDKWKRQENQQRRVIDEDEEEEEEEEEEERSIEESDQSEELKSTRTNINVSRTRGKYKCETCKKVFRSYQALGGHRASHKKIKVSNLATALDEPEENAATTTTASMPEKKVHQCPVCFRVFSSGQALGGHKRSHVTGSYTITTTTTTTQTQTNKSSKKVVESLIDLNLPAPVDEDEVSQIEHSAVSDGEFVNPIRH